MPEENVTNNDIMPVHVYTFSGCEVVLCATEDLNICVLARNLEELNTATRLCISLGK